MNLKEFIVLLAVVAVLLVGFWVVIGPEKRCDLHTDFNYAYGKVMGRPPMPVMSMDCIIKRSGERRGR